MVSVVGYRVSAEVYRGAHGGVFRALRLRDNLPVIIKVPLRSTPRDLAKIRHEFEIGEGLEDSGVVRHYELARYDRLPALVTEDFGGVSLRDQLSPAGWPVERVLVVAIGAAKALGLLHRQGIIHKDVQPNHILLNPNNLEVRLIDLGLAARSEREVHSALASTHLEGALPYMSPEQTGRTNRTVDSRADLYSLGATLYEMIVGKTPFATDDPLELVHAHMAREVTAPGTRVSAQLPELLDRIVLKLLSKSPEDRYNTAFGLVADLEECQRQYREGASRAAVAERYELGRNDPPETLHIPESLYGRDRELAALDAARAEVRTSGARWVLLHGGPGMGKTALCLEWRGRLAPEGARFLVGRFEESSGEQPYRAFAEAFQEFVRQLLASDRERLARWKERLVQAFAGNGRALLDLFPDLALIVGEQPAIAELGPLESRHRFEASFRSFLSAIAAEDDAPTLILEDLHLADAASVALLQAMVADPPRMLLVLSYQSDLVGEGHRISALLGALRGTSTPPIELHLRELGPPTVHALLADTLGLPGESESRLAESFLELRDVISRRTDGNPLQIRALLKRLYREGLLRLDRAEGRWVWDIHRIRALAVADDLAGLSAAELPALPAPTKRCLAFAAVLGRRFDLLLLSRLLREEWRDVVAELEGAINAGVLVPETPDYLLLPDELTVETAFFSFAHDRLVTAAYADIAPGDRAALHQRVGQLMLELLPFGTQAERVMEIVRHLNLGRDLLSDERSRLELTERNLQAAARARSATAYEAAVHFLGVAADLLGADAGDRHHDLFLRVHRELGECCYMSGDVERAEREFLLVTQRARTTLERLPIYEMKIAVLNGRGESAAAIEVGQEALRELGIALPRRAVNWRRRRELRRARRLLAGLKTQRILDLPRLEDPLALATLRILTHLATPAFLRASPLFPLIVSRMSRISLENGLSSAAPYAFAALGLLLAAEFEDYELAEKSGLLAMDLVEKLGERELRARVHFLYGVGLAHWRHGREEAEAHLALAAQAGKQAGDLQYAGLAMAWLNGYGLWSGSRTIEDVRSRMDATSGILYATGQRFSLLLNDLGRQYMLNLQGAVRNRTRLTGEVFRAEAQLSIWTEEGNATGPFLTHSLRVLLCVLFAQYEEGLKAAEVARGLSAAAPASLPAALLEYWAALCQVGAALLMPARARGKLLHAGERSRERLNRFAKANPENFQHRLELVEAQLSRARGETTEAIEHFERAASGAQAGHRLDEALVNELAAHFFQEQGRPRFAAIYARAALEAYAELGYSAKVEDVELRLSAVLTREVATGRTFVASAPAREGELDMSSVFKASSTMTGQLQLEGLLATLLSLVMENAGAQRALFILWKEEGPVVAAEGQVGREARIAEMEPSPLLLPLSVLHLTERSRRPVVLDDATREAHLRDDEYIRNERPRSVLALPILARGKLVGIVYLEHKGIAGQFSPDRIETLNLLSAQMGVSLENAQLYSHLQESLAKERQARATQEEVNLAIRRFVPSEFLRLLGHENVQSISLGEYRQTRMAVLFSDIRSFTALSETMTPEENFKFINSYLGQMGPVVREHGGFIDKYIGDAIMALFESADSALRAAVAMHAKLAEYNEGRVRAGFVPIRIGIGVNSGDIMLGTIGETHRMDGTVISDAVNLASRLEGVTKMYGSSVVVSATTLQSVDNPLEFEARLLDIVQVKGKSQPVTILEILDAEPEAVRESKRRTKQRFEQAVHAYLLRDFTMALSEFRALALQNPDDRAASVYAERCQRLLATGVAESWEGVTQLDEK